MSNAIIIFSQIVILVGTISAVWTSWYNGKKIQEIHLSINSRMDQLLQATSVSERAIGAQEEREKHN